MLHYLMLLLLLQIHASRLRGRLLSPLPMRWRASSHSRSTRPSVRTYCPISVACLISSLLKNTICNPPLRSKNLRSTSVPLWRESIQPNTRFVVPYQWCIFVRAKYMRGRPTMISTRISTISLPNSMMDTHVGIVFSIDLVSLLTSSYRLVPELLHLIPEHPTRAHHLPRGKRRPKRLHRPRLRRVHFPHWARLHRLLRFHQLQLEAPSGCQSPSNRRPGSIRLY